MKKLIILLPLIFLFACEQPDKMDINGTWLLTQISDSEYINYEFIKGDKDSTKFIIDSTLMWKYNYIHNDSVIQSYIDLYKYEWISNNAINMSLFYPGLYRLYNKVASNDTCAIKIIGDTLTINKVNVYTLTFLRLNHIEPTISFDSLIYKTDLELEDFMVFKKNYK